jgi:hypothetical protein
VAERAGLVSVAAVDPAPGRDGRELAEVAGFGSATGVVVEAALTRLRDIEADVVLFAPEGDLDSVTTELEILLEFGLNVVVILPDLAYPPDDDDDDLAVSIDTTGSSCGATERPARSGGCRSETGHGRSRMRSAGRSTTWTRSRRAGPAIRAADTGSSGASTAARRWW